MGAQVLFSSVPAVHIKSLVLLPAASSRPSGGQCNCVDVKKQEMGILKGFAAHRATWSPVSGDSEATVMPTWLCTASWPMQTQRTGEERVCTSCGPVALSVPPHWLLMKGTEPEPRAFWHADRARSAAVSTLIIPTSAKFFPHF